MCNLASAIREEGIEQGIVKGIEQGIEGLLKTLKELEIDRETACVKIMKRYDFSREEAEEKLKRYWD